MNDLVGGIDKCFYCFGDIVAEGMCARCLNIRTELLRVDLDPYEDDDYLPELVD